MVAPEFGEYIRIHYNDPGYEYERERRPFGPPFLDSFPATCPGDDEVVLLMHRRVGVFFFVCSRDHVRSACLQMLVSSFFPSFRHMKIFAHFFLDVFAIDDLLLFPSSLVPEK
jgi:hypothetical protein